MSDKNFIVGAANDPETNPVGHWPWMASLGNFEEGEWNHQCGATLISDRHFLTAAHCAKEGLAQIVLIVIRQEKGFCPWGMCCATYIWSTRHYRAHILSFPLCSMESLCMPAAPEVP